MKEEEQRKKMKDRRSWWWWWWPFVLWSFHVPNYFFCDFLFFYLL